MKEERKLIDDHGDWILQLVRVKSGAALEWWVREFRQTTRRYPHSKQGYLAALADYEQRLPRIHLANYRAQAKQAGIDANRCNDQTTSEGRAGQAAGTDENQDD